MGNFLRCWNYRVSAGFFNRIGVGGCLHCSLHYDYDRLNWAKLDFELAVIGASSHGILILMVLQNIEWSQISEERYMNARSNQLQLTAEYRQIKEAICVAFHSILVHRVFGKFKYSSDVDYSLGSLGHEEVQCAHIDLTYVRVNSREFVDDFDGKLDVFVDAIMKALKEGYFPSEYSSSPHSSSPIGREGRIYGIESWEDLFSTQIKLEFYQRRKRQWPIPEDTAPWEIWELRLNLVRTLNNEDFFRMREYVAEQLSDTVLTICELVNKPQYLPKIPTRLEITSVYDARFADCDPYLWRLESEYGLRSNESVSTRTSFVKKLLRDTLSFS